MLKEAILYFSLIIVILSGSVDGLRRHSDGIRGPLNPVALIEETWRPILKADNGMIGLGGHPVTRMNREAVKILCRQYAEYLSLLTPYHWDLDLEDGTGSDDDSLRDRHDGLSDDDSLSSSSVRSARSKQMGEVLVSLFEFLEEFPNIPQDHEVKSIVADMDRTIDEQEVNRGHSSTGSFSTIAEIASIYNEKTMMEILMKAADTGNSKAQHILASVYATGVLNGEEGLVPLDAGRSLMLHYRSALSGNAEANIAMGYRYAEGIGVQESCAKSIQHYEYAANIAINDMEEQGYQPHLEKAYLSQEEKTSRAPSSDNNPEVLQYYSHLVDEGDTQAAVNLGRIYMHGNKLVDEDVQRGMHFLKIATDSGSPVAAGQLGYALAQGQGGEFRRHYSDEDIAEMLRFSSMRGDPYGVLGYAYVHFKGIGIKRNHTKAFEMFQKVSSKHPDAFFYMGEMLSGQGGVPVDDERRQTRLQEVLVGAKEQIEEAAQLHDEGLIDAVPVTAEVMLYLMEEVSKSRTKFLTVPKGFSLPDGEFGRLVAEAAALERQSKYKIEPDYTAAVRSYSSAAQRGHPQAMHRLSHMTKLGMGTPANCIKAVQGFRAVAEAGQWAHKLTIAHRKFSFGSRREQRDALRLFARLAPMGFETAQYNAAHLLSRRVHPSWYRVSQSTTTKGPPQQRLKGGATPPRELSLSWLPWAPWKFAQSGIPEPVSRLLTRDGGPSDRQILEHNRQADKLKSSVSKAAARRSPASDGEYDAGKGANADAHAIERGPTMVDSLATFGWDVVGFFASRGQALPLVKSFMTLLSACHHHTVEAFNRYRDSEARALNLYALSAGQGNADAHLRLGDFHYYGLGWLEVDKLEAASFYQNAADLHHTHAIFNLGVMHETGDGVRQDFHLAKRFYDQAAEFNMEARIPRTIALFMLNSHQYFSVSLSGTWIGEVTEQLMDFVSTVYRKVVTATRGRLRDSMALSAILFSDYSSPIARTPPSDPPTGRSAAAASGTTPKAPPSPYKDKPFLELLMEAPALAFSEIVRQPDHVDIGPHGFLGVVVGRSQRYTIAERREQRREYVMFFKSQRRVRAEIERRGKIELEHSLQHSEGLKLWTDHFVYLIVDEVHVLIECFIMCQLCILDWSIYFFKDVMCESLPMRLLLWPFRAAALVPVATGAYLLRFLPFLDVPEPLLVPEIVIDVLALILVFVVRGKVAAILRSLRIRQTGGARR